MIKVEVCMGTTCFVLGGEQFTDFDKRLPKNLKDKVEVIGSRCLGLCRGTKFSGAPYVRINGVPVGNADPGKVLDILQEMAEESN